MKQPGVDVRARRGYRAATDAEVTAARKAADAGSRFDARRPGRRGQARRVSARPAGPGSMRSRPARARGRCGSRASAVGGAARRVAQGAIADIEVMSGTNSAGTGAGTLKPGERTFLATVSCRDPRAMSTCGLGAGRRHAAAAADGVRLRAESAARPLYFRRGPTTGNRWPPARTCVSSERSACGSRFRRPWPS